MKKLFFALALLLVASSVNAKAKTKELPDATSSNAASTITVNGLDGATIQWYDFVKATRVAMDLNGSCTYNPLITQSVAIVYNRSVYPLVVAPGETITVTADTTLLNSDKQYAFHVSGSQMDDVNTTIMNLDRYFGYSAMMQELTNPDALKGKTELEIREAAMKAYSDKIALIKKKVKTPAAAEYFTSECQMALGMTFYNIKSLLRFYAQAPADQPLPENYFEPYQKLNPLQSKAFAYGSMSVYVSEISNMFNDTFGIHTVVPEAMKSVNQLTTYTKQIKEFTPLTDEQLSEVRTNLPLFADRLLSMNDELLKTIEENSKKTGFEVKEISADLKGEDVFKALVKSYEGKPVLVDFWATWCGPCRQAMKTILPIKEDLAGKVAFIYITGPSSPTATWKNMIPDIHGDHYYVTAEQWSTLLNQFESQGIPTYVVVRPDGTVQNKFIGFPGEQTMRTELENALNN